MENLEKALSGPHMEDIDNNERAAFGSNFHIYPNHPSMTKDINDFHSHFIDSTDVHVPIDDSIVGGHGSTKNAYRKPTGQLYLIKTDQGSVENEMLAHRLFHAAGIGHLCQKVHLHHHIMEDGEAMPTVVIHGANTPEVHCDQLSDHVRVTHRGTMELPDYLANNSHFLRGMAQIDVMDHVIGNTDRHARNVMLVKRLKQPNSSFRPLAIDHGLSMTMTPPVSLLSFKHPHLVDSTRQWWEGTGKPGILDELASGVIPPFEKQFIQKRIGIVDKKFSGGW